MDVPESGFLEHAFQRGGREAQPAVRVQIPRLLLPVLEQVVKTSKPLMIVADDVEGEALSTLIVNRLRGTRPVSGWSTRLPGP